MMKTLLHIYDLHMMYVSLPGWLFYFLYGKVHGVCNSK